jgi:hypothetical protein
LYAIDKLPRRSRHDEPPFIEQETKAVNNQLAWESLLPVHEVADQNEEDDEDVQVDKGREEEVVGKEQECLCPVSAFDGSDDACGFDGTRGVGRPFESDDFG